MKKKRIGGVLAAAGAAAVLSGLCTGRAFCLDMESYAGLLDKERMSGEPEYMVSGDQECRRLLMELVSAGAGKEREEFFITGEDYEPETLVSPRCSRLPSIFPTQKSRNMRKTAADM